MDKDSLIVLGCLGVLGVLSLTVGMLSRLGYLRSIYAVKGHPVLAPPPFAYVSIFIGMLTLFLGIVPVLPIETKIKGDLLLYLLTPGLILTYVLAIWQPWWLKPAWLRWLEKEHGDIIYLLWEDVREDRWGWERRVRTQQQLEDWVAEVRRRIEWQNQLNINASKPFMVKVKDDSRH